MKGSHPHFANRADAQHASGWALRYSASSLFPYKPQQILLAVWYLGNI